MMTTHNIIEKRMGHFRKSEKSMLVYTVHCTLSFVLRCNLYSLRNLVLCWKHIVDLPFCYLNYNWYHELFLFTSNKRYRMYFIGAYCIYVWGRSLSLTGKYFDIVNNDFTSTCISFHFIWFHCQWSQNYTYKHRLLGNELEVELNYH